MKTNQETVENLFPTPFKAGSVIQAYEWELRGQRGKGFIVQFEEGLSGSVEVRINGNEAILESWEPISNGQRLSATATVEVDRLGDFPESICDAHELSSEASCLIWDFAMRQGEFA